MMKATNRVLRSDPNRVPAQVLDSLTPAVVPVYRLDRCTCRHSHGLVTLFREPCVIHHPRHYRFSTEHRRQYKIQTPVQNSFITPWGVGHYMMQRLMHAPHPVGSQSGSHRLHARAFSWQQQHRAVVLQRDVPVSVPCGFREALDIRPKALFLWAWRGLFAHEPILHQNVLL